MIAVVLRMADCQGRARENAGDSVLRVSGRLRLRPSSQLESIADVNEAALQAEAGKLDQALELYQHALQLDDSIGDKESSAEDWLAYGRFLDSSGFPARLAYACFVKSGLENALTDASQKQFLAGASKRAESRIGPEAAAIRRDPTPFCRKRWRFAAKLAPPATLLRQFISWF